MKQKSVGLTLRAAILALALILVAGSPALPPFDGVAYAQTTVSTLTSQELPDGNPQLDWTAVAGADSYGLWKGDGSGTSVQWGSSAHMTLDAATVTYVDSAVVAGRTYSYVVEAMDGDTRLSWSNVLNITIPGGTAKPTGKPTVTLAADGLSAITVSWTTVADADHYQVRYWTSGLSGWMDVATQETGGPVTHTGLTPGTQYYYIVRGENAAGNGPYSGSPGQYDSLTLDATTTVPQLTLAREDRTTVDLSWTSTGAGAQYELQRRKIDVDKDGNDPTEREWERLPSGLLTERSYRDSAANYVPVGSFSVKYEYRVRAQDSDDLTGNWSNTQSVNIPKAGAVLDAPVGLAASPLSESNIRVLWDNVLGADFYELQWKSGDRSYSTPIRVNRPDSGKPDYEHTNLSPSTKYTYQVRAIDVNGAGDWSSPASTSTRSTAAAAGQMPKVTGLSVADATSDNAADQRMAKLTWSAVSDATHYEIQRYDPSNASTAKEWGDLKGTGGKVTQVTKAMAGSPPAYTDNFEKGAAGKTYFYVVSAVEEGADGKVENDGDNEMGEWSDYKSVTFKAHEPGVPTKLTAVKTTGNSILVSWEAPAPGEAPGTRRATSYTLRWRPGDSSTWSNIAVTGTSYHHTQLRGNTSYHYRVRAENSGGESDYVDLTNSVVLGNTLNPPTGLTAVDATTSAKAGIKVSWSAVSGASSYEVQRFKGATWGSFDGEAGGDNNTLGPMITDKKVVESMTYLYRVRTVKEDSMSSWSAPVSGTTKAKTPPAPTLVVTSTGMFMFRLSWNEVPGATTYELEFLEGMYAAGDFGDPNIGKSKMTISGNSRNYVHMGRRAGTRYSYRLRAALAQGGETDWSVVELQYTKPDMSDLSAKVDSQTSTTMVLTWDAVSFVNPDGSAGRLVKGSNYRIQRRLDGNSTWDKVQIISSEICPGNKCMVKDEKLTASMEYDYRIRATVTRDKDVYTSYWDYVTQRTPAPAN